MPERLPSATGVPLPPLAHPTSNRRRAAVSIALGLLVGGSVACAPPDDPAAAAPIVAPSSSPAPSTSAPPTTRPPSTLPPTTRPPTTQPTTTEPTTTTLPSLRPIDAEAPLRAFVGGDSLPAYIITALNAGSADNAMLRLTYDAHISSSIVNPSFFDWQQQLALILDNETAPEAIVFMIGGNDNQPMTDAEGNRLATLSPEWLVEYRRRVAAIMDLTNRPGVEMFWVGLPPPRDGIRIELNPTVNGIFFTEAEQRPWVTFLDIGQLFSDADGNYAARLPGPDGGDPVTVRPRDGVHITYEGSKWIADLVWDWMVETWSIPPSE